MNKVNLENDILKLDLLLQRNIQNLFSGYSSRRNVEDHHAITCAIFVYFRSNLDLLAVEKELLDVNNYVRIYYDVKDGRLSQHDYYVWHNASRKITDYIQEKGYHDKPNSVFILDLIEAYIITFNL